MSDLENEILELIGEDGDANNNKSESFGPDLYHDDVDRERLENLPELEREQILASRAEKRQHNMDLNVIKNLYDEDDVIEEEAGSSRKKKDLQKADLVELKRRRAEKGKMRQIVNIIDIKIEDLRKIQITRSQVAKWMFTQYFVKTVIGSFVRLNIGNKDGRQIYRICEVIGVEEVSTPYFIEKSITNKVFLLKHAEAVKQFNIQNISNNYFDQGEFDRWRITMKVAKLRMPSFEDIQKKQLQIKDANEHNLTHQEVDEMVKIKKELRNSTFLLEKSESSSPLQKESSLSSIKQQEGKNLKSIDIFNKTLPILETGRIAVKKRKKIPRKNLDSILHDDTLNIKLEPTDPNYRFQKAINRKMKKLETLLYSADIDMRLVPDPRYEIVREFVETEYEKKYENFRRTVLPPLPSSAYNNNHYDVGEQIEF
ncbi:5983_t:CDS:2 [Entrophospora sp. SA101]|nr:5983_t:CDS:2 [Entrophospora sp. SA101]